MKFHLSFGGGIPTTGNTPTTFPLKNVWVRKKKRGGTMEEVTQKKGGLIEMSGDGE